MVPSGAPWIKGEEGGQPGRTPKGLDAIGQGRVECQQQCSPVGCVWEGAGSDPDPSTPTYSHHMALISQAGLPASQPAERGRGGQFVWKQEGMCLKRGNGSG